MRVYTRKIAPPSSPQVSEEKYFFVVDRRSNKKSNIISSHALAFFNKRAACTRSLVFRLTRTIAADCKRRQVTSLPAKIKVAAAAEVVKR